MAAVVTAAQCDDLRRIARDLAVRPGVRLHWVTESVKRRDRIAAVIANLDVQAIVAVGAPMANTKQERARSCCLERLLYELDQLTVREVWLESRREIQDGRDLALVDSARDKGLVSRHLKVGFAKPADEPMLWLPDGVAGAVTAEVLGDRRWIDVLVGIITRHRVALR
ncbi:hypothetical protein GCM10028799_74270 [Kribbella italica]